ncbi:DUF2470 domain-containing protein [Streptomyces sp. KK5PA1]|uniref:DUF2470 domain-containing protein n=1 Tax=Actinacidiphila acididurans TaxID=2784346 RepID=A0ABS2U2F0_9ACTN|nr:DUF2470 domain-containing protein [Actinacidiphila acididurans]
MDIPGLSGAETDPPVPLRHFVAPTGDVFLLFPGGSAAVRAVRAVDSGEAAAVLEVTDVAPVAVPHRIRGRARVVGWLSEVPGGAFESGTELLKLEPAEVTVDDLWGAGRVEPEDFAAATPDPLAPYETAVLQHLAADHAEEVAALSALIDDRPGSGPDGGRPPVTAVPLALDAYGLRVRFSGPDGLFDAYFDFPEPVDGVPAARRALHALFRAVGDED